jgi:hypothetical protein
MMAAKRPPSSLPAGQKAQELPALRELLSVLLEVRA